MPDRAFIVHKDGRFAIGGFGCVFEGIYTHTDPSERSGIELFHRDRLLDEKEGAEPAAHVFDDRYVVAVCTDRPTYRPGHEVQFKLIARRLGLEDGKAPSYFREEDFELASRLTLLPQGTTVRYTAVDSKHHAVASGELQLNDFGTAAGTLHLNNEAATGAYSFRLFLGGKDRIVPEAFAVKYYRRPDFELKLEDLPTKIKSGTKLKFTASGQYYLGAPVAGGKISVRLSPAQAGILTSGQLDVSGRLGMELPIPANLPGGKYSLLATLEDSGRRRISIAQPIEIEGDPAKPAPPGLAALPGFIHADAPFDVYAAGDAVRVKHLDKKAGPEQRVPLRENRATLQLSTPGWYRLSVGQESMLIFAYGDSGDPFEMLSPTGEKDPDWEDLSGENRIFQLPALFDRHKVEVGGKLRILVYLPCKSARLLFTLEGETVVDYFVTSIIATKSAYHIVEIPIKSRHLPNFYLQGRVLSVEGDDQHPQERVFKRLQKRAEGLDPPEYRVDVFNPHPIPGEEKLHVHIETDAGEYKPGSLVNVQIGVTDLAGKPRSAEVALAAVDESIYHFGEDHSRSLATLFADPHPDRRLTLKKWRTSIGRPMKSAERMQKQLQELAREAVKMEAEKQEQDVEGRLVYVREHALAIGGGGLDSGMPIMQMPLVKKRLDFRETAAWQPQLRTGPDGLLRTSFQLPDSLTRYRLTAVALTKEMDIGRGETKARASLPLTVQVLLPRFAVEGDKLLALGLIHNRTARERECTMAWEVEGAEAGEPSEIRPIDWELKAEGGKAIGRGRIKVPANGSVRVGLWIQPKAAGEVRVSLRCDDGKEGDAEERTMPVHPLGRDYEIACHGDFSGTGRVELQAGFRARELTLCLATSESAQGLDGLEGLLDYPHGCVEQTMSRFLPAVVMKSACMHGPVTLPDDVNARLPEILSQGLNRLYHFQHSDGGWGWWEKDDTNNPMSAYVVYGLAQLQAGRCAGGCRGIGEGVQLSQSRPGRQEAGLHNRAACLASARFGRAGRCCWAGSVCPDRT